MLASGQQVDRYEVQALLGQGGMAAVYRVRHRQLHVDRALKVLTIGHPGIRQRLLLEGRVQASLSHPNVVGVTDVIEVEGQPGLLMEYVAGPSLQQWLEACRPTLDEALALFRGIAAGVGFAHQHDLIHRDLKPANVLVLRRGAELIAKVADFGLAKMVADEIGDTGNTRTGIGMGTPSYMAPEQIRDAKRVDKRGDIFALGCILYELCTGRQAFTGDDILAQLSAVAAGDYVPPERWVPDLPPALTEVIAACLRVDREERLASCEALLDALPPAAPVRWSEQALRAASPPPEQALPAAAAPPDTRAPMTLAPTPSGGAAGTWTPGGSLDPEGLDAGVDAAPSEPPAPSARSGGDGPSKAHRGRNRALLIVTGAALLTVGGMWANDHLASDDGAHRPGPDRAEQDGAGLEPDDALTPDTTPATPPDATATPPPVDDAAAARSPTGGAGEAAPIPTETAPQETAPQETAPAPAQPVQAPVTVESPAASAAGDAAPGAAGDAAPGAAEPPVSTGVVRFLGDAESVSLTGQGGTFGPGEVPVGTYDIIATFPGREPARAGRVTVTPGADLLLRCRAAFVKCVP